jgi:cytochrome c biogenesis protein CcmG, thiol:disulfide interchange protein DsbE
LGAREAREDYDVAMARWTLLLVTVLSVACAPSRQTPRTSPLVGKPLEVAAPDLDGREVRVHDAQGQVRVVDFWATWCEPCLEQLPFLDRLSVSYAEQGLRVYAVSFDEDRATLERFLDEHPLSFPVLWDRGGTALSDRLMVTRLPTTLLLDREGRVREVHLGFAPSEAKKLEDAIRRLLAE